MEERRVFIGYVLLTGSTVGGGGGALLVGVWCSWCVCVPVLREGHCVVCGVTTQDAASASCISPCDTTRRVYCVCRSLNEQQIPDNNFFIDLRIANILTSSQSTFHKLLQNILTNMQRQIIFQSFLLLICGK